MPPFQEPDWATPGASGTAPPPAPVANANVNNGSNAAPAAPSDSKGLQSLISVVLILLCMAMTALGVFVFIENEFGLGEFTEYFVAGYMVLFALLLFLYECMWWCTIDKLNHSIRKNFGFMYGIKGKALYLIFVACLCIGIDGNTLGDKNWLRWVTGIGWGAMGIALLAATIVKPELFENYKTATGGFTDADMTV